MSFDDFYANFDTVQFCHLSPDSYSDEILKLEHDDRISWKLIAYHDEWINGKSAGGCGNNNSMLYWTNPQFLIKLAQADAYDKKCTIIVSLIQKYTREKRFQTYGQQAEEFMQFRLFKVINPGDALESIESGKKLFSHQLERVDNSGDYINKRDVVKRFRVPPGDYLIIPSLYEPYKEGQFLLRIFSEQKISRRNAHILNEHNIFINSIETNEDKNNDSNEINLDNVKISVRRQYATNSSGKTNNSNNDTDNMNKKLFNPIFYKNKKHILVYFHNY
jgi:calpain-2